MGGIIIGVLEQGLIYGIMALGICISYKILDFPDLSVDGTFPLGAAVSTALVCRGINPWLCLLAAAVCGALAGAITGFFNVKLKIKDLLAGILMYKCRNIRFKKLPLLSCLMPVIFNAVFVGAEIAYFMAQEGESMVTAFFINAALVALGELISVYVLGLPLYKALENRKIFSMS